MPTAITATAGSATANSFLLESECDTYCDDRLNAGAWNDLGAGVDGKLRALIEATREIDLLPWKGQRVDATQALSWPRDKVPNPDDPDTDDPLTVDIELTYFATTVVPQRVKDATAELALEFLRAGSTDIATRDEDLDIKRKKVDVLETEFMEPHQRAKGLNRYPQVYRYIWELLDPTLVGGEAVVRV